MENLITLTALRETLINTYTFIETSINIIEVLATSGYKELLDFDG